MSSGVCMRCEESFISDALDVTRCRRREFNTDGRVQNCPPGRYVLNGLCQEALPNGACNENSTRIANVATGGCEPCPSGCVTCEVDNFAGQGNTFSKTQCTTCLPGKVLVDGTCEDRCPSGRFISPQDGFSCLRTYQLISAVRSKQLTLLGLQHATRRVRSVLEMPRLVTSAPTINLLATGPA